MGRELGQAWRWLMRSFRRLGKLRCPGTSCTLRLCPGHAEGETQEWPVMTCVIQVYGAWQPHCHRCGAWNEQKCARTEQHIAKVSIMFRSKNPDCVTGSQMGRLLGITCTDSRTCAHLLNQNLWVRSLGICVLKCATGIWPWFTSGWCYHWFCPFLCLRV